jgi:hypothetical protein
VNHARRVLIEDEHAEFVRLVRDAIAAEPYRIGPRINKLRLLLAKLEPSSTYIRPKADPSWWPQR